MSYIAEIRRKLSPSAAAPSELRPRVWRKASGTTIPSALRVGFAALFLALLTSATPPSARRANTFVAFGPQEYVRATSGPTPQTTTFNVLDPTAAYTLRLDVRGVSSAVVTLNGAEVVRPSDFNANTTLITRRVTLKATNQLKVELRGKPGGSLTLQIIGDDDTPPSIVGVLTPAPNAAGWNNTGPTVTFDCSDATSGIASCSGPVTLGVETEGQAVTGTAFDKAGNTATASVTVKFDWTPPGLNVTAPVNGARVFTTPLFVGGAVTDALSGLASVTCNGVPAAVNGANFGCGVPLTPGANSVEVIATDVAGNTSRSALSLTYTRPPAVAITSPVSLSYLNISPTTVTGTVDDPGATVTVNSVPAAVAGGRFSVALPLAEGPNTVTASATSATGATGTASVAVTLDTTPPRVTITSPPDQFTTTEASLSVAGSVNDIVVGTVNAEQAQVSVNGVAAQVSNRTFLSADVPLNIGPNIIRAVGRDRVGNAATTEITVTRQSPSANAQIKPVSGNNQSGAVGSLLPSPLVVALTDDSGRPVPDKQVIFKVVQNDGLLSTGGGPPAPTVIATTDAEGRAQAQWKLGMRAGAGGNTVEAYAVGFQGTAVFTATGAQGPAGKIVVDTGNDQIGVVNQPLPKPLIAVVVDAGNNRLAGVPVTFTVKEGGGNFGGRPSFTVNTDSDGRAAATPKLGLQEGNANNLFEVNFTSNQGFPTGFTASGRAAGDPSKTAISGVVLDNSNVPIPGVTLRAVLTNQLNSNSSAVQSVPAVQTDAQGQFTIPQAPVGFVKLMVDGTTAQRPGPYPTLDYDMVTVTGHDNTVGMPIFLLPLNTNNQLCVTPTTGGGTLTVPEAPGFSLTFGPDQVTFPGGSKTGCVSVTVVHPDKVPMTPGFGQQPRFIVTIQPAGAHFNPPAAITLPNVDGLRPREVTEMYSFDHDIGSFVAIGTGVVSDDGLVIRSSPGVGVIKAGWHCGGNPNPTGSAATCKTCWTCQGNSCVRYSGPLPTNEQTAAAAAAAAPGAEVAVAAIAEPPQNECKECQNGSVANKPDRTPCGPGKVCLNGICTCAIPVNFRQVGPGTDMGGGTLHFDYEWDSSTGYLHDLWQCTVGEEVRYDPKDLPFPSPPFPLGSGPKKNPTVKTVLALLGEGTDDHKTPGTFVQPYREETVIAEQFYWYSCPCKDYGTPQRLAGPIYITRSVTQRPDGKWKFTVRKQGSTATIDPLP